MGVSAKAYAVVGLEVDPGRLVTGTRREPAFDHGYAADVDFDFCPRTGRKLWRVAEEYLPGYDPDAGDYGSLAGYPLVHPDAGFVSRPRAVVALAVVPTPGYPAVHSREGVAPLPTPDSIAAFRAAMESLGLWHDARFGLHLVLYYA